MVSCKQKGDKAEREVYKIFESWGYIVNPAPRTMRTVFSKGKMFYVSQRNDHWGCFDGEARTEGHGVLFQVKSNITDVSKVKIKIMKWAIKYGHESELFDIWLRVARKGYVRYLLVDNKEWIRDYYDFKGIEKEPFKITD